MKESNLFKNVTDRQLPDMEAIKKACTEQKPAKPKIFSLKPSRMIAVAVIASIAVTGMVVAFATQGGKLFFSNPATEPSPALKSTASETKKPKHKTKSKVQSSTQSQITTTQSTKSTEPKATDNAVADNEHYENILNDYGFDVSWAEYIGDVDDYAVCIAGNSSDSAYTCDYIMGGYTISSPIQRHPYGLGIYAVNEGLCCTLSEAYEMNIFSSFNELVTLISESGKCSEFGISVESNDTEHSALSNYYGSKRATEVVKLGSTDTYTLYYRISGTYTGEGGYTVVIGDMTFDMINTQQRYQPGLYVVSGGEVYTMTQAINEDIASDTKVLGAMIRSSSPEIPFNWTFSQTAADTEETDQE